MKPTNAAYESPNFIFAKPFDAMGQEESNGSLWEGAGPSNPDDDDTVDVDRVGDDEDDEEFEDDEDGEDIEDDTEAEEDAGTH